MKKLLLIALILFSDYLIAQEKAILSGPMLGYRTMKEVGIWIQTSKACDLLIKYNIKDSTNITFQTETFKTSSENHFIAKFKLDKVLPGKNYSYRIFNGNTELKFEYPLEFKTPKLWQHREDPPDFKFALGSCVYINEPEVDRPGVPYGNGYEIFNSIVNQKPEFMLWLGDNNYLREVDWNSETGIYHRYSHSRNVPEMQKLLASTHHFAIWDDHDFGPNNSDGSFWNKKFTEKAFKDFWMNPNYNQTGQGGITGTFIWEDCQFFLLDNRYFRTANNRKTGENEVLGDLQVEWLINSLKSSNATFKFIAIGGQFISNAAIYENNINLAPKERQKILDMIKEEEIKGVVFFSGDRHHTEMSVLKRENAYPIYDWTVSPLTSNTYEIVPEGNTNLLKGSSFGVKNFGVINVHGKAKERILSLKLYNALGEELWGLDLNERDLR